MFIANEFLYELEFKTIHVPLVNYFTSFNIQLNQLFTDLYDYIKTFAKKNDKVHVIYF